MIKYLTALGFLVVLVCAVFVVVEDVVHHRRSPGDPGHYHVAVDGFGYVGRLVAHGVANALDRHAVAAHD